MDLRKFIEVNIESGYASSILGGAESSMFYPDNMDVAFLIKKLLDLSDADKQQIYSQLQSGGISETQLTTGVVKKKLSFCTDFPIIIDNILTLLGFDFAKHLIALTTLPLRLKNLIKALPSLKSYEECKINIQYIYNILSLKDMSNIPVFNISSDFSTSKYAYLDEEFAEQTVISMSSNIGQLGFFDKILTKIDKIIAHKNFVLLNKDKQMWSTVLNDLVEHMTINPYEIYSTDDLCIFLGEFDVGYEGSFIKQFNMLYRENYAGISPDILSEEYIDTHKPHIDFLNNINFDNYQSYLVGFNKYFKNIYKICMKEMFPEDRSETDTSLIRINIVEDFYEHLSQITLNLFIRIAKNIASAQSIQSYFGKSNRVQFIQIMSALVACQPRAEEFTESQRMAIHYFLLTSKLLNDSYTMLTNHESS